MYPFISSLKSLHSFILLIHFYSHQLHKFLHFIFQRRYRRWWTFFLLKLWLVLMMLATCTSKPWWCLMSLLIIIIVTSWKIWIIPPAQIISISIHGILLLTFTKVVHIIYILHWWVMQKLTCNSRMPPYKTIHMLMKKLHLIPFYPSSWSMHLALHLLWSTYLSRLLPLV